MYQGLGGIATPLCQFSECHTRSHYSSRFDIIELKLFATKFSDVKNLFNLGTGDFNSIMGIAKNSKCLAKLITVRKLNKSYPHVFTS